MKVSSFISFTLIVFLISILSSCNNDNVSPTNCQVCGTWRLDSVTDIDGNRSYFNLNTPPYHKRFYSFTEDKIYYIEDNDTIVYNVLGNSVLNQQNSKISWNFNSVNDTFFIESVNNINLIWKDYGSGGTYYQTDYLTKIQ